MEDALLGTEIREEGFFGWCWNRGSGGWRGIIVYEIASVRELQLYKK